MEKQSYPVTVVKRIGRGIMARLRGFRVPWVKIGVVAMLALIASTLYFTVVLTKVRFMPRPAYDKEGYVDARLYREQYGAYSILENDDYRFEFNNNDTTFTLTGTEDGAVWTSNPVGAAKRYSDPLVIYYAGNLGAVFAFGVAEGAVQYDDFSIKKDDNSLSVLYNIGGKRGIDASDFPKVISRERMEEKILSMLTPGSQSYRRITETCYGLEKIKNKDVWRLKDGKFTSTIYEQIYDIFYNICGYTKEDLEFDHKENGIEYEDEYPYIEIALAYTLTPRGLHVRIIGDSIYEKEQYPFVYADLLPYFGAAGLSDDGYSLIPDGCGALIEHNNDRSFALPYCQHIYGDDGAKVKNEMAPLAEKISLPVIGIKRNNNAFIAIAKTGAEMASVIANISTNDNPYNQAYYRYHAREQDSFLFSSYQKTTKVTEWTLSYNADDFEVLYRDIKGEDSSYAAMAGEYRAYLKESGILSGEIRHGFSFNLILLGGYTVRDNVLGIPYRAVRSLTNTEEAYYIAQKLYDDEVRELNVIYRGWCNEGIKPAYIGEVYYDSAVGRRKDFLMLQKNLADNNVCLYPEILLQTAYTDKNIKESRDAVRNVLGKVIKNYDYNEAVFYADSLSRPRYTLIPPTYEKTLDGLLEEFKSIHVGSVAFHDAGRVLYGSYRKKETYLRGDTLAAFRCVMDESPLDHAFYDPNLYAFPYCRLALDVPVAATPYQIVGQSVPFYQLALSGYINYSGRSFNTDDSHSYEWHVMRALETASGISFTWSYHSPVVLADTEYSGYYASYYKNWYDRAVATYHELNNLGLFGAYLSGHRTLTDDGRVVRSEYSNGAVVILNYGTSPYVYDGEVVSPGGYIVTEGRDVY